MSKQNWQEYLSRSNHQESPENNPDSIPGCTCSNTEIRGKKTKQGIRPVKQCLDCGSMVGDWLKRGFRVQSLKSWDDSISELYQEWRASKQEERWAAKEAKRDEQNEAWWEKYNKYLESPEWRAKRLAVLMRDEWTCQGCLKVKAAHVHHQTYANVGDELLFQLIALCHPCHSKAHHRSLDNPTQTSSHGLSSQDAS